MIFPRVLNVDVALVGPQDSNAPRVYAPSWMQRPMEAVRYMPSVATAQPSVPQAITQLQLPQGWVKSREEKKILEGMLVLLIGLNVSWKMKPILV